MSKKRALIWLGLINFLVLPGLWLGYDSFNKVIEGIANSDETVSLDNRFCKADTGNG